MDLESAPIWNRPLDATENFVVVPTRGALVEGWLLIVPRTHFLSIGHLPEELFAEFDALKQRTIARVERVFGPPVLFEHGPSEASSQVGCGVDHAHLHITPLDFDLEQETLHLMPRDSFWVNATAQDCVRAAGAGQDYLYFEQPVGNGRIATSAGFPSQLFRRAIANWYGKSRQFDWKQYDFLSNIHRTREALVLR